MTTRGASPNGSRPFDLDAAAKAAPSDQEPFPFTWHGADYVIRPPDEWPIEAQDLVAEGQLSKALGQVLEGGDEAAASLRDSGMTIGSLNLLFDKLATSLGLEGLGNLPAPARPGAHPR